MGKPVTGLTVFGSSTSGTTTQLDNNFLGLQNAINDTNTYENYYVDSGSANNYSVTFPANITGSLTAGLRIAFSALNTNTGASQLNVNGMGQQAIINPDGSVLRPGQIVAGGIYTAIFSGTNFVLQNGSGGGQVVLGTFNSNGNTSVNFNNSITSAYDLYKLILNGVTLSSDGAFLSVRVGTGNTPTYQATNYGWGARGQFGGATGVDYGSSGNSVTTGFAIVAPGGGNNGVGNAAGENYSGELTITVMTGQQAIMTVQGGFINPLGNIVSYAGSGAWQSNTPVTSIQVIPSNGNIPSGNFALVGIVRA